MLAGAATVLPNSRPPGAPRPAEALTRKYGAAPAT
jgi:hypothetical protein